MSGEKKKAIKKTADAKPGDIKVFPIYGEGDSVETAEADLEAMVSQVKTDFKLKLEGKPVISYRVQLYKGETPGRSKLSGEGETYAQALSGMAEDFGINVDDFKKQVQIRAVYQLTPEEAKKVVTAKPVSAGPVYRAGAESGLEYVM